MARIPQSSRKIARVGTNYPATITDVHGNRADARLSGNGAILHNLQVVGGPVSVGEQVEVDHTTPDPTIVAVSKDWLSIEDILRALDKLPKPLQEDPFQEWDKLIAFNMDETEEWYMYAPNVNGWYDAQERIETSYNDLGYLQRWAVRVPSCYNGKSSIGSQAPATHECWFPQYIYGAGRRAVTIHADDLLLSYGVYMENLNFDFWWHEERAYHSEGVTSFGWTWFDEIVGNPIYSPSNNYLMLPTQIFEGQIFKNCQFRAGNGEYNDESDSDPTYNYCPITLDAGDLDGFYWTRDADDFMIFDNCRFTVDPDSSNNPCLIENYGYEEYDDGYDTHINLYNSEVDCGDTPVRSGLTIVKFHSEGTLWGTNPLNVPHLTFDATSDRAAIDHTHSSGSSGGNDPDALHLSVSGEINMVTEKTSPVGADIVLIEDSEASWAKKKVQLEKIAVSTDRIFLSGTITTGSPSGGAWVAPGYGAVDTVYMHMVDTGSSGNTVVDVNKNGTSVFSGAKMTLAYDDADGVVSQVPDTGTFSPGDIFTVDVDSVAGGTPTDLTVIIVYNLLL